MRRKRGLGPGARGQGAVLTFIFIGVVISWLVFVTTHLPVWMDLIGSVLWLMLCPLCFCRRFCTGSGGGSGGGRRRLHHLVSVVLLWMSLQRNGKTFWLWNLKVRTPENEDLRTATWKHKTTSESRCWAEPEGLVGGTVLVLLEGTKYFIQYFTLKQNNTFGSNRTRTHLNSGEPPC